MVEAVGFFFPLHVLVLFLMESLHREQSDRINANIMEVELLVQEVNTRFVKQRDKKNIINYGRMSIFWRNQKKASKEKSNLPFKCSKYRCKSSHRS